MNAMLLLSTGGYQTRAIGTGITAGRRPSRPEDLRREIAAGMREFMRLSRAGDRHGAVEVSRRLRVLEARYVTLGR